MYRIAKDFEFSASHQLDNLPQGHKCARLHGHNYKVTVVLQADQLDRDGFVVDYGTLDVCKKFIDDHVDHRHLNYLMEVPTTAENLAYFFYRKFRAMLPYVKSVKVSETPKTWAEYSE